MEGDSVAIWNLLFNIWCIYNNSSPLKRTPSKTTPHKEKRTPVKSSMVKKYATEKQSPTDNDYSYLLNTEVQCDLSELRNLEVRAISWLKSLNMISSNASLTFKDIEENIRNGTILCNLASMMGGGKIKVYKSPKTDSAALYNIRKAFDAFRKFPRISHKYLWNEREVHNGDIGKILGLLDTLQSYYEDTSISKLTTMREVLYTPTKYHTGVNPDIENSCNEEYNELSFKEHKVGKSEASVKTISNSPLTNTFEANTKTGNSNPLLSWVQRILREAKKCKELPTDYDAFRNGVILAHLMEVLEHKEIEGINFNPKTSAASLNNIRRVLGILKNKWKIPLMYIYSEHEIFNGDKEVIQGLLKNIKNAYNSMRFHNRSKSVSRLNKSQERTISLFNGGTNIKRSYIHD